MTEPLSIAAVLMLGLGGLAVHMVASWRHDRSALTALLALDVALVVMGVGYLEDDVWNAWMREDAWVEWVTFYAFITAGVLFVRGGRRGSGLTRVAGFGLGLFCLFVGAEEISWGQRLFSFEPPDIFLEANYQQEFNVHNLLKDKELGPLDLDSRYLVALIAVAYGVLGPLLPLIPRLGRRLRPLCPSPLLIPGFALVAWFEWEYPVHLAGEAAECFFGLLFLVDAGMRFGTPILTAICAAGVLGVGAITAPLLDTLLYGSDEERIAEGRDEMSLLGADMVAAVTERLESKGRVHKRLYTAVQAGYLDFGLDSSFLEGQACPGDPDAVEPRKDRKGYLLDPWNNAYWVLSTDNAELVLLYSFGPNRRRDTDTRPFEGLGGDDLGVVVKH